MKLVQTQEEVSQEIIEVENTEIVLKSERKKIVALSVTKAKIIAIVQCVQEMLYIMRLIQFLQLKVRKSMIIYSDNKGTIDMINGRSVGGEEPNIWIAE